MLLIACLALYHLNEPETDNYSELKDEGLVNYIWTKITLFPKNMAQGGKYIR